jgi:hypothetical protein
VQVEMVQLQLQVPVVLMAVALVVSIQVITPAAAAAVHLISGFLLMLWLIELRSPVAAVAQDLTVPMKLADLVVD